MFDMRRRNFIALLLRWPVFQSPLKAHAPKIPTSNIAVPHEGIEAKAASAMIAMTMKII